MTRIRRGEGGAKINDSALEKEGQLPGNVTTCPGAVEVKAVVLTQTGLVSSFLSGLPSEEAQTTDNGHFQD